MELWDVYDINRNKTGKTAVRGEGLPEGGYHLVVHVCIIGMIILGFGIVQLGLSLKSHDPSQRANGFLTVAGGIVITFAKEILNTITG